MVGIVIGVIWYVLCVLVLKNTIEVTIMDISNFLFWWYCVWGAIVMLIPLLITGFGAVGTILGVTGADEKAFGGGVIVGLVGVVLAVLVALKSGLFIAAAWLVYNSGNVSTPFAEWDTQYLIAAGICAFLGILLNMGTSSVKPSN